MSTDQNSSEKKPVEASSGVTGNLPPPIALYQLATGHYISRSLFLVARLGIADLLSDGPRHCNDLAKSTETHAPSLRRVMRLLASGSLLRGRER
jgi:Dimerisation domain